LATYYPANAAKKTVCVAWWRRNSQIGGSFTSDALEKSSKVASKIRGSFYPIDNSGSCIYSSFNAV